MTEMVGPVVAGFVMWRTVPTLLRLGRRLVRGVPNA